MKHDGAVVVLGDGKTFGKVEGTHIVHHGMPFLLTEILDNCDVGQLHFSTVTIAEEIRKASEK